MGSKKKISQLPGMSAINGSEELPLHKSGVTVKTTVNAIKNLITKESIGLANVDNTSDLNKPVSNATRDALNLKSDTVHSHSISQVIHLQENLDNKSNVGHSHTVDNIANLQPLLDSKAQVVHNHSIGDVTGLQAALDGKLSSADFSNKADINHIHSIADISNLQSSLNNKSDFTHTHTKFDIGLDQVDNTSDINKPISNLTKNYIDTAIAGISVGGLVTSVNENIGDVIIDASSIGLGNVDNTEDVSKPLSVPQKTYIDNAIATVVATGGSVASVNGKIGIVVLDPTDIGLGNVNNTSDLDKPVSTATETRLALKSDLSHIHQLSDVDGLVPMLNDKTNIGHLHVVADIIGLDNYVQCGDIEW